MKTALTLLAALLLAAPASAAHPVLRKVDKALNDWKTLDYHFRIRKTAADLRQITMEMRLRMRPSAPSNAAHIEVLAPESVAGTRIIVDRQRGVHVRRPNAEAPQVVDFAEAGAGLVGVALDLWEASATRYAPYYTVEARDRRHLTLRARPGAAVRCARLDMVIDENYLPRTLECYAADGTHLRSEARTGISFCFGAFCSPARITLTNRGAAGGKVVMDVRKWRLNERMYVSLFEPKTLR